MSEYYPNIFSAVAIAVLWLLNLLLVRLLHKQWWAARAVRKASWIAPLTGLGLVALWTVGTMTGFRLLLNAGAMGAAAFLTLTVAITVALPVSGIALTLERFVLWIMRRRRQAKATGDTGVSAQPVVQGRRSFLSIAAASLPAATMATSGMGILTSYSGVRIPEIPLRFPGLPKALQGLRVWHLSDSHIGYFTHLSDLEKMLLDAGQVRPDIALVTGDFADDVSEYPEALRMLSQLKTRYGVFASLGNHEYFHDLQGVLRSYERGPVPLLRGTGTTITVGDARLFVGGADDPVTMRFDQELYTRLRSTVESALNDDPGNTFRILMSHRPEGFDVAAEHKVELTLSGHTHGRQIGFNGRSVFESFAPERYLWGHYTKGNSQLYTSAGAGHWFPFRLGCPPEAPLYILQG